MMVQEDVMYIIWVDFHSVKRTFRMIFAAYVYKIVFQMLSIVLEYVGGVRMLLNEHF